MLDKTDGNPFFIKQLFSALHQENLLEFNSESDEWQWDIQKIQNQDISENVVDLMVNKI